MTENEISDLLACVHASPAEGEDVEDIPCTLSIFMQHHGRIFVRKVEDDRPLPCMDKTTTADFWDVCDTLGLSSVESEGKGSLLSPMERETSRVLLGAYMRETVFSIHESARERESCFVSMFSSFLCSRGAPALVVG